MVDSREAEAEVGMGAEAEAASIKFRTERVGTK